MADISSDKLKAAALAQHPALFNPRNRESALDEARVNALAATVRGFQAAGFSVEGYADPPLPPVYDGDEQEGQAASE